MILAVDLSLALRHEVDTVQGTITSGLGISSTTWELSPVFDLVARTAKPAKIEK